jgi:hypothetical protein
MTQAVRQKAAGTALITGASSGIGYEFARLLARQGYDVVLVARNRDALNSVAAKIREDFAVRADIFAKDLSAPTACDELFAEMRIQNIVVDILINDAGFAMQGPFTENDTATLLDMLQVNIVALTQLTRLFLPGMIQRGRGKILNMASIGSFMPGPLMAAYFASKAYVLSLSEALANELQGTGVTVTALCPGPTRTKFAHRARLIGCRAFRGKLMEAVDVAQEGMDAMRKGKTVLITGFKMRLQMLPTPLVPRRWLAFFARQYHEAAPPALVANPRAWEVANDEPQPSHVAQ